MTTEARERMDTATLEHAMWCSRRAFEISGCTCGALDRALSAALAQSEARQKRLDALQNEHDACGWPPVKQALLTQLVEVTKERDEARAEHAETLQAWRRDADELRVLHAAERAALAASEEKARGLKEVLEAYDAKLLATWGKDDNPHAAAYGWVRTRWELALSLSPAPGAMPCGAWSVSLDGACDLPAGHDGRHCSKGDEFGTVAPWSPAPAAISASAEDDHAWCLGCPACVASPSPAPRVGAESEGRRVPASECTCPDPSIHREFAKLSGEPDTIDPTLCYRPDPLIPQSRADAMVAEEREQCAKVADEHHCADNWCGEKIGERIRARKAEAGK